MSLDSRLDLRFSIRVGIENREPVIENQVEDHDSQDSQKTIDSSMTDLLKIFPLKEHKKDHKHGIQFTGTCERLPS